MNNLMEKLAISKAIMDRHNDIGRGQTRNIDSGYSSPEIQNFETPQALYNLPQDILQESKPQSQNNQPITKDRILSSKLPDEIKKLMIENPINASNPLMGGGPVLSDELVEKASKLMGTQKKPSIHEQPQRQSQGQNVLENNNLRQIMKEVVQEVLMEHGLITESSSNANEIMMIKVGKHIFEGKISKVKKTK